jgi:hypothetical protein
MIKKLLQRFKGKKKIATQLANTINIQIDVTKIQTALEEKFNNQVQDMVDQLSNNI